MTCQIRSSKDEIESGSFAAKTAFSFVPGCLRMHPRASWCFIESHLNDQSQCTRARRDAKNPRTNPIFRASLGGIGRNSHLKAKYGSCDATASSDNLLQAMLQKLIQALVDSKNEAADELLLEALRIGTEKEKTVAMEALLRRKEVRGLSGVIELYDTLPQTLQQEVIAKIGMFHHALRECGRSDRNELRLAAMKLIALARQGMLAFVLSENLHDLGESLSKSAVDAMVAMARWVAMETRSVPPSVSAPAKRSRKAKPHPK